MHDDWCKIRASLIEVVVWNPKANINGVSVIPRWTEGLDEMEISEPGVSACHRDLGATKERYWWDFRQWLELGYELPSLSYLKSVQVLVLAAISTGVIFYEKSLQYHELLHWTSASWQLGLVDWWPWVVYVFGFVTEWLASAVGSTLGGFAIGCSVGCLAWAWAVLAYEL